MQCINKLYLWSFEIGYSRMADSRLAPSQRETSLQSNAVSHWLGANLESALNCIIPARHAYTQPVLCGDVARRELRTVADGEKNANNGILCQNHSSIENIIKIPG